MTKKIVFFFASTLFLSSVFGQSKISSFKIEGNVQGFVNGTKLYLNDLTDGSYKQIDSAIISNDKFVFRGNIKTGFLLANISTTGFEDRITFWLESGTTHFTADKGNFKIAKIKGSKIQDKYNELNKLRDTLENIAPIDYVFIKNNTSSIISAHTLSFYLKTWGKDTLSVLYHAFSKNVKNTKYGEKIRDFLLYNQAIKIGDNFVDFTQKDINGIPVSLSDFKGKVVLLEFWGSWCGGCRETNPGLVNIYNEFKEKGFEILAVASETDKQKWLEAIKKDNLTWTNVTDLKGSSNKASIIYGITAYPTNFLIDKNGKIIDMELYGENLRNMLLKIL